MMTAKTSLCGLVLVFFALVGCSSPLFRLPAASDQQLFARGLDQFIQTGETRILASVPREYPESPWSRRSEAVLALIEEQRQQERDMQKGQGLEEEMARCREDLVACRKDKSFLESDNQMLEETLEKLRKLLIDMELRAK